jgi:glycogen(starch) synthase
MRVLFWSELFWPHIGGIEVFGVQLIRTLKSYGYQFAVITSQRNPTLPREGEYQGTPIFRLPFEKALRGRDMNAFLEVRRQVSALKRCFKPAVIHINGVIPSSLIHLQTIASYPSAVLVTLHQELFTKANDGVASLTGQLLRSADWVNGVSTASLTQACQLVPEIVSRSSVISNSLMALPVSPAALPFAPPGLLCVGRLAHQKGFDIAIRALHSIKHRFTQVQLVIAGDGPERTQLKQQIVELGLFDDVELLGWVAPQEIPAIINNATIVLMPSRIEGLPLVALQAAMMERPIVATRVGGLPEIIVDQQTGLLVEPEDSDGLAQAVVHLLDHPDVAAEMGKAARRRVAEIFSWERCVSAYNELYRHLARQKHALA